MRLDWRAMLAVALCLNDASDCLINWYLQNNQSSLKKVWKETKLRLNEVQEEAKNNLLKNIEIWTAYWLKYDTHHNANLERIPSSSHGARLSF